MAIRYYVSIFIIAAALIFPTMASSHGHSLTGESQTIFEAYGMACNTALHEVHKHPVISKIRVIPGGIVIEVTFLLSPDLPVAVEEAIEWWDRAGMTRWYGEYNDAHRFQSAGPVRHVRPKQLAWHFRSIKQDVCDHRRKAR